MNADQWRIQDLERGVRPFPFPSLFSPLLPSPPLPFPPIPLSSPFPPLPLPIPSPSLPFPSLPLEVGPLVCS